VALLEARARPRPAWEWRRTQGLDTRRKDTLAPHIVQARFGGNCKPLKYQG